jgi:hypothetical protein
MQQSQTLIRGTQTLLVASREAANYCEPWTKRVAERREVTAENVTDRVSPRYVSLIIDQAKRVNPKEPKISTLFSPDAYDLLCRSSASPFWFWRIVAQAADTSSTLPLSAADISEAIKEVGYRWYIGSSLGRKLMERSSLPNLQFQDRDMLVAMHREGFIVPRLGQTHNFAEPSTTLEINPIFVR